VRIEIKPVTPEGQQEPQQADTDEEWLDEANQFKDENWPDMASRRQPLKPLMDPEVVRQFLAGDYCLYGGTGWWKYEFCYGKKVDQYHEERNGRRTTINLGVFDRDQHLDWIESNPVKRPKAAEARKHVSHYYSGGDLCDVTRECR